MISAWLPAAAQNLNLPLRLTPRPATTDGVPHIQLDAQVFPELSAELLRRAAKIPGVEIRDTVISLPGAKGFWLADQVELAHPEAIVRGREFAHVHPDGGLHASLEPAFAILAVKAGWAIHHPWADERPGWEGFVMIYSPISADELDTVVRLVVDSYNYVTAGN